MYTLEGFPRVLNSLADTEVAAGVLAPYIKCGMCVGLSGPLGAGKTTFVRALIGVLGGDTKLVSSPTFVLNHEYETSQCALVQHWDLYRLAKAPPELREPAEDNEVRFIEWAERDSDVLSDLDLIITIEVRQTPQGETREISALSRKR